MGWKSSGKVIPWKPFGLWTTTPPWGHTTTTAVAVDEIMQTVASPRRLPRSWSCLLVQARPTFVVIFLSLKMFMDNFVEKLFVETDFSPLDLS